MAFATRTDTLRAGVMLTPAYIWLTAAIFLPLSAMLFFSFASAAPFVASDWRLTIANYAAFFSRALYPYLLVRSLSPQRDGHGALRADRLSLRLRPCQTDRGRSREALFLLIILPFWSNSLVRIFSWAIVLRGNGLVELAINAALAGTGVARLDVHLHRNRHRARPLLSALRGSDLLSRSSGDRR